MYEHVLLYYPISSKNIGSIFYTLEENSEFVW
jgi:hypothetical protein